MTADEQILIWGSVVCVIMVLFAAGVGFMLFYCWKNKVGILGGKYGSKEYSRDSQPFGYWSVMIFYTFLFLFLIFTICALISFLWDAGKQVLIGNNTI